MLLQLHCMEPFLRRHVLRIRLRSVAASLLIPALLLLRCSKRSLLQFRHYHFVLRGIQTRYLFPGFAVGGFGLPCWHLDYALGQLFLALRWVLLFLLLRQHVFVRTLKLIYLFQMCVPDNYRLLLVCDGALPEMSLLVVSAFDHLLRLGAAAVRGLLLTQELYGVDLRGDQGLSRLMIRNRKFLSGSLWR